MVHLWNVPSLDQNGDIQPQPDLPLTCAYPPKDEQGDLTSLDWSADGSLLAIGCYDSVLRICDTNGKMYFSHSQHDVSFNSGDPSILCLPSVEKGPIFAARFSPGGRWLVTASLDGSVCVWDVQGKRLHRHYMVHQSTFPCHAYDSRGTNGYTQNVALTLTGYQNQSLLPADPMVLCT